MQAKRELLPCKNGFCYPKNRSCTTSQQWPFPQWHKLKELKCQIEFIHGDDDPAHSLKDVQQLANSHATPLHVIADAGHMVYDDHLSPLCEILRNISHNHQAERPAAAVKDTRRMLYVD